MKKNTFLKNSEHKQTFHSKDTYCKKNDEIKIVIENLDWDRQTLSLNSIFKCTNLSFLF